MFGLTPLFKVQIRPLILYTVRFLRIFLPIKMSHSMYMLNIQIDSSLNKFNNIKLTFFAIEIHIFLLCYLLLTVENVEQL